MALTEPERGEVLKRLEDRIAKLCDEEGALFCAVLYKVLYARGLRIGTIDQDIRKALE